MRTIIKGSEGDKMENILNYVRLRQDISFQMSPFNVIDALILSDLAYVDWNNIVKDEKVDLQRACRQYFKMHTPEEIQRKYVFSNNVPNLAKEVSRSNRFKYISLMKYREVFDEEKNIQFSVVTFVLPDETLFISYRGTDGSITGWKENMQMTYMSHLPCQKMAAEYAEEIIDGIEEKSLCIKKYIQRFIWLDIPRAVILRCMQLYLARVFKNILLLFLPLMLQDLD